MKRLRQGAVVDRQARGVAQLGRVKLPTPTSDSSQPPVIQAPENLMPSSGFHVTFIHMAEVQTKH